MLDSSNTGKQILSTPNHTGLKLIANPIYQQPDYELLPLKLIPNNEGLHTKKKKKKKKKHISKVPNQDDVILTGLQTVIDLCGLLDQSNLLHSDKSNEKQDKFPFSKTPPHHDNSIYLKQSNENYLKLSSVDDENKVLYKSNWACAADISQESQDTVAEREENYPNKQTELRKNSKITKKILPSFQFNPINVRNEPDNQIISPKSEMPQPEISKNYSSIPQSRFYYNSSPRPLESSYIKYRDVFSRKPRTNLTTYKHLLPTPYKEKHENVIDNGTTLTQLRTNVIQEPASSQEPVINRQQYETLGRTNVVLTGNLEETNPFHSYPDDLDPSERVCQIHGQWECTRPECCLTSEELENREKCELHGSKDCHHPACLGPPETGKDDPKRSGSCCIMMTDDEIKVLKEKRSRKAKRLKAKLEKKTPGRPYCCLSPEDILKVADDKRRNIHKKDDCCLTPDELARRRLERTPDCCLTDAQIKLKKIQRAQARKQRQAARKQEEKDIKASLKRIKVARKATIQQKNEDAKERKKEEKWAAKMAAKRGSANTKSACCTAPKVKKEEAPLPKGEIPLSQKNVCCLTPTEKRKVEDKAPPEKEGALKQHKMEHEPLVKRQIPVQDQKIDDKGHVCGIRCIEPKKYIPENLPHPHINAQNRYSDMGGNKFQTEKTDQTIFGPSKEEQSDHTPERLLHRQVSFSRGEAQFDPTSSIKPQPKTNVIIPQKDNDLSYRPHVEDENSFPPQIKRDTTDTFNQDVRDGHYDYDFMKPPADHMITRDKQLAESKQKRSISLEMNTPTRYEIPDKHYSPQVSSDDKDIEAESEEEKQAERESLSSHTTSDTPDKEIKVRKSLETSTSTSVSSDPVDNDQRDHEYWCSKEFAALREMITQFSDQHKESEASVLRDIEGKLQYMMSKIEAKETPSKGRVTSKTVERKESEKQVSIAKKKEKKPKKEKAASKQSSKSISSSESSHKSVSKKSSKKSVKGKKSFSAPASPRGAHHADSSKLFLGLPCGLEQHVPRKPIMDCRKSRISIPMVQPVVGICTEGVCGGMRPDSDKPQNVKYAHVRITEFPRYFTYEIMKAGPKKPFHMPIFIEQLFVTKKSEMYHTPSRRKSLSKSKSKTTSKSRSKSHSKSRSDSNSTAKDKNVKKKKSKSKGSKSSKSSTSVSSKETSSTDKPKRCFMTCGGKNKVNFSNEVLVRDPKDKQKGKKNIQGCKKLNKCLSDCQMTEQCKKNRN